VYLLGYAFDIVIIVSAQKLRWLLCCYRSIIIVIDNEVADKLPYMYSDVYTLHNKVSV
jgi:hypothetical protein